MTIAVKSACLGCGRTFTGFSTKCPRCLARAARREQAKVEEAAQVARAKAQREQAEGAEPRRRWR
jgi:hypothetical protein